MEFWVPELRAMKIVKSADQYSILLEGGDTRLGAGPGEEKEERKSEGLIKLVVKFYN